MSTDIESRFPKVSHRELNPRQQSALRFIIRYFKDWDAYNGVTSIHYELRNICKGLYSVAVWTRRSDCGKYSERQVLCERTVHIHIGPRGGLTCYSAYSGFTNDIKHICKMLGAKKGK